MSVATTGSQFREKGQSSPSPTSALGSPFQPCIPLRSHLRCPYSPYDNGATKAAGIFIPPPSQPPPRRPCAHVVDTISRLPLTPPQSEGTTQILPSPHLSTIPEIAALSPLLESCFGEPLTDLQLSSSTGETTPSSTPPPLVLANQCCMCKERLLRKEDGARLICTHTAHISCLHHEITHGKLVRCGVCSLAACPTDKETLVRLRPYIQKSEIREKDPKAYDSLYDSLYADLSAAEFSGKHDSISPRGVSPTTKVVAEKRITSSIYSTDVGSDDSSVAESFRATPQTPPALILKSCGYEYIGDDYSEDEEDSYNDEYWVASDIPLKLQVIPEFAAGCLVRVTAPVDAFAPPGRRYHASQEDDAAAFKLTALVNDSKISCSLGSLKHLQTPIATPRFTAMVEVCCPNSRDSSAFEASPAAWEKTERIWTPAQCVLCDTELVLLRSSGEQIESINTASDDPEFSVQLLKHEANSILKINDNLWIRGGSAPLHLHAALHDHTLQFPLADPTELMNMDADYRLRSPVRIAVVVPSALVARIVPAALGNLGPFDRLGLIVQDSDALPTTPHNASWEGWSDISLEYWDCMPGNGGSDINVIASLAAMNPTAVLIVTSALPESLRIEAARRLQVPFHCVGMPGPFGTFGDAVGIEALARETRGTFAFAAASIEAAECVTGVIRACKSVTHHDIVVNVEIPNVRIMRARHPFAKRVVDAPGNGIESQREVDAITYNDHTCLRLGEIKAGQTIDILLDLECGSYPLGKNSFEVHATVAATCVTVNAPWARTTTDLSVNLLNISSTVAETNIPDFTHGQGPVNMIRLVEYIANAIERCIQLAVCGKDLMATSLAVRLARALKDAAGRVPESGTVTELARARVIFRGVIKLLGSLDVGAASVFDEVSLGRLIEAASILGARESFTRRNEVAAVFFESLDINIF